MRQLAALLAALVVLASGTPGRAAPPDPRQRVAVPVAGAPTLGTSAAAVTIVEFSDFYCPYCGRANAVIAEILRLYPGRVRLVYRHSLLDSQRGTLAAHASLAAAAQGQFWPFHDRLFASPAPTDVDGMVRVAGELGLDVASFRRDLVERRHAATLAADDKLARRLGVDGIPQFFVNGRPISGAQPLGVFVRLIEEELAIADALVARGVGPEELYDRLLRGGDRSPSELLGAEALYARGVDTSRIGAAGVGAPTHRRGGAEPLVTIVEFSDFDCGYCARVTPTLLELVAEHEGDVGLSFRHFPLGASTKLVAEAAEAAADQGKFWELHDRLFATRKTSRADLLDHARAVGLDVAAFEQALDERRYARAVAADAAEGGALGVTGTPTFFINGRPVVGAPSPTALRELIAEELKAARALLARGIPRGEVHARLLERASLPEANTASDERVEIDPVDYHIAVLLACREGDAESAARFYREVKDAPRRRMLRADCKRLGIALPK